MSNHTPSPPRPPSQSTSPPASLRSLSHNSLLVRSSEPWLSFAARGRFTAPPRAAASARRPLPARRGAPPLLRRLEARASRYLSGGRLASSLRLRQRATPAAHRAAPPRQVQARLHAHVPALPHREPRRVEYRPEHDLPERSLLPLPRAPLSDLPGRLPGHLRPLDPLHQPLVQRHSADLPAVPRRRHGHPQRPPRLIPRLHPIRLRPTLHQHPPPPPPPMTQHRRAIRPQHHKHRPKPHHLRIPPHRSPSVIPASAAGIQRHPTTRPHPSHPRQPTLTRCSQPPPPPFIVSLH